MPRAIEVSEVQEKDYEFHEISTRKLWSIARLDLGLDDFEFLSMKPAVLDILMRRLQVRDRKAIHGAAMICAEMYNLMRDREHHPQGFTASDFLPELPEERARRLREEHEALTAPIDPAQFAEFKQSLLSIGKIKK